MTLEFGIGGGETPDETLIQHAVDILSNYPSFKQTVSDFLTEELKRFRGYEEEIGKLKQYSPFLSYSQIIRI